MTYLQLDQDTRRTYLVSRILLKIALAGATISLVSRWVRNAPDWLLPMSSAALLVALIGWIAVSRRVRCPYCNESALMRLAPSWHKPTPASEPGTIRCGHCHEVIEV